MKKKVFLVTLLLVFFTSYTYSQDKKTIGLSGSVQSSQFGILIPIWVGERMVLAPAVDFKYAQTIGTEFSIGLAPRYYLNISKVSPYIGLKVGGIINIPSDENEVETASKFDFLVGLAFGGEYFIDENFSLGVEVQGNLTKSGEDSNRFGNPGGLNFNTATMISATVYF